ncbi:MAG: hypothetical protein ACM3ME_03700 [Chloroflexota bacterium]|jgi:heme/copper-type cytochrome/quinol oxidase subunit 2|nr:hypothetical protein [Lentimicrobium sp.]
METLENIKKDTISVGEWLVTIIVTGIPLIGIIMLFVWSFSSGTHPVKSNWAKAMLIVIAISIILSILIIVIFGAAFLGLVDQEMINQEY